MSFKFIQLSRIVFVQLLFSEAKQNRRKGKWDPAKQKQYRAQQYRVVQSAGKEKQSKSKQNKTEQIKAK